MIFFIFQVLQTELSVLKHNQIRVHELSSYLMLSDSDDITRVTRSHQGSKATDSQARLDLMHRLQVLYYQIYVQYLKSSLSFYYWGFTLTEKSFVKPTF